LGLAGRHNFSGRSMADDSPERTFPDHVDKAVRSVSQLHSQHHERTPAPQRAVNRMAASMGRPRFIVLAVFSATVWIAVNLMASRFGLEAVDPPPFPWLELTATLFSLLLVMLVLVAQRHEDQLNAHRDTLTLELAILSEHKIAKVIQLLEELRRDSPHIEDRDDPQAMQMAEPADAGSVLDAVRASDEQ
jgi:uncharacterized membrane protein